MSDEHPTIDDPELGTLARATTELTDGSVLTHDWYSGTVVIDGVELELMLEGTSPQDVTPLLPRVRETIADLTSLRRIASDAVVTNFSNGEPEPHELDDAASDLTLETIEAAADGTIILHLIDSCGEHFPEGYWPAVHLGAGGDVEQVTVES
ncbi:hypothetical protein GCM10010458_00210 [Microbacterium luteolum]|uniref:DUF2004 domain-containing protein n=1 Tax=Microbacterium luteolum TaxID=69367 RepID=A0ABY7XLB4_MICLT|nr:hypothetical protein [Microbacterium luteolum]WDM42867.1 hypothetical protein KV395_06170 [Microbacterium luteolum]